MIQFYYTYSFNGLERNTSADPHSYEIGSCYSGQLDIEVKNIPNDFSLSKTIQIHLIQALEYNILCPKIHM